MRLALFRLFFCTLLLSSGVCSAEVFAGRIVGVIDGDTVDVLIDTETLIRVRLSGIDAPERKQAFGSVAKKALSELTFDRRVIIEAQKVDQWGRLIGKVLVAGNDANLAMVKNGLAFHYKKYQHEQPADDRQLYAAAELAARTRRIGLWADEEPVPPWEFRSGRR